MRMHAIASAALRCAVLALAFVMRASAADDGYATTGEGRVQAPFTVPSQRVPERHVQVWLPPGYADGRQRYPVLYMHDGQNVFARGAATGSGFGRWNIDLAMDRLLREGKVRPAIIVAIDNTPNRTGEYMPGAAYRIAQSRGLKVRTSRGVGLQPQELHSDDYLRYLVEELKPYIDGRYRTLRGRRDTFVMGSSMGGLISLYAMSEYPKVFGGAACLSTHWPIGDGVMLDYLPEHLPDPATHRLYFDRGTATLDATYPAYQDRADGIARANGYVEGRNFMTRVFEGAAHDEASWSTRADIPLRFLLAR